MSSLIIASSPSQPGSGGGYSQPGSGGSYSQSGSGGGYATSPLDSVSPATVGTEFSPALQRNAGNGTKGNGVDFFSNDVHPLDQQFRSRYLRVDGFTDAEQALTSVECVFKECTTTIFNRAVPLQVEKRSPNGRTIHVLVRFDDINDASVGLTYLRDHGFLASRISQREFHMAKFGNERNVNNYEGQVKLVVTTNNGATLDELPDVVGLARRFCEQYGPTHAIQRLTNRDPFVFRVEFASLDAAVRAVNLLDGQTFPMSQIDMAQGNAMLVCKAWSELSAKSDATTATAPRLPMGPRNVQDTHNRVNREHIVHGYDVRTTVMLRNIPNKMDWLSLKEVLDQYCFGTYDFLYLRIDFKTGSNVGYAFVNFAEMNGMTALIDNIEHRQWRGFRSGKAAEISYATIQGKEALIAKFRNSSVMQETPYCRPRLFVAQSDYGKSNLCGTELSFPAPDNMAKLSRSIESARANGLFPPHASTLIHDRTRQGVYDNGNPRDRIMVTPKIQRDIEVLFSLANRFVWTPFANIPPAFVQGYLASINAAAPIGVIGQPVAPMMYAQYPAGPGAFAAPRL